MIKREQLRFVAGLIKLTYLKYFKISTNVEVLSYSDGEMKLTERFES